MSDWQPGDGTVRACIREMSTTDVDDMIRWMIKNGDPREPSDRDFVAELAQEQHTRAHPRE